MRLPIALLSAITLAATLLAGDAQAIDMNIKGLEFGMSPKEVRKLVRKQSGNDKLTLIQDITSIPLGLDYYNGVRVFTWDTEVTMQNAYGFPPVYFHRDRLFAYKVEVPTFRRFTELIKLYPNGRYFHHKFPDEKYRIRVFEAETDELYVLSNCHKDLLVFHNPTRKAIINQVKGSYCWHTKLYSPNLAAHVNEYAGCMRTASLEDRRRAAEDLESCMRYCENTPELFSSPNCPTYCAQARDRAEEFIPGSSRAASEVLDQGKLAGTP